MSGGTSAFVGYLAAVVCDLCARDGRRAVLIVNGHGGNWASVTHAVDHCLTDVVSQIVQRAAPAMEAAGIYRPVHLWHVLRHPYASVLAARRARLHDLGRDRSHQAGSGAAAAHSPARRGDPGGGECHRITGEDCFHLTVHLRSIDELSSLLDRFLAFGETTASIINASPDPTTRPPIDGDEQS